MANCSCVADLEVKYTALAAAVEDITAAVDSTWLLIATYLVFFMQTGFALLEAGKPHAFIVCGCVCVSQCVVVVLTHPLRTRI